MRLVRLAPILAAVALLLGAAPAAADGAVLLDRVAARVDERILLRSDVLARARPFAAKAPDADPKMIYRQVLAQMVDEILIEKDASRKHVTVSDDEVRRALETILTQNKIGRPELDAELAKNGIAYDEYLLDIRRQILEAKWLELSIASKGERPKDPQRLVELLDARRKQLLDKLHQTSYVDIRE